MDSNSHQLVKFILPVVGNYAYFDHKMKKHYPHFIVNTEYGDGKGCHYSTPYKKEFEPFVTCHGKIISIPIKKDYDNPE